MEKELLDNKLKECDPYELFELTEDNFEFGRKMPFGKYKGMYIYYLLLKHYRYMGWIINNTQFKLNETERWWKENVDWYADRLRVLREADRLLGCLGGYMTSGDLENIENPHMIIE